MEDLDESEVRLGLFPLWRTPLGQERKPYVPAAALGGVLLSSKARPSQPLQISAPLPPKA